jgi:hypothetical protein
MVVVANAPDPKESFYRPAPRKQAKAAQSATAATQRQVVSEMIADQGRAAVAYSFPGRPEQFEVTRANRMMDVPDGGKIRREAVAITTIVAR